MGAEYIMEIDVGFQAMMEEVERKKAENKKLQEQEEEAEDDESYTEE